MICISTGLSIRCSFGTTGQWSYQSRTGARPAMLGKSRLQIFQEITVPDLLKQVFADSGFTDYEMALTRTYPEREYCVQYRESTLNFVLRLMEEEGIYFYKHDKTAHYMMLVDDQSGHDPVPGQSAIKYRLDDVGLRIHEYIPSACSIMGARVLSGQVALNAYFGRDAQGRHFQQAPD